MAESKKNTRNMNSEGVTSVAFSDFPIIEGDVVVPGKVFFTDNLEESDEISLLDRTTQRTGSPIKVMTPMIFTCHGGEIKLRINGEHYTMSANSFLFIKPGNLVETISFIEGTKFALVSIAMGKPKGNRIPSESVISFSKMLLLSRDPLLLQMDDEVGQMYLSVYKSHKSMCSFVDEKYVEDLIIGFMSNFSAIIMSWTEKRGPEIPVKMDKRNYVFHAFIDNIHKHAYQHRDVAFYADKACMTTKYFSDVISTVSSKPPTFWIKDYVILEAKALLGSGLYSIQQISDKMNFANASFFCKYFKSYEHITPGEFMKKEI